MRPFLVASTLAILAVLAMEGCRAREQGPVPARAPRLVLVYATCSLNKDFLSPYNARVPYTRALERFKRDAVVFARHHTEAGQSGIAYASIFSGTQATEHGIFAHPSLLTDDKLLLSEVFAAGGYEAFAWLGHVMASSRLGYAQGVAPENQHKGRLTGRSREFRDVLRRLRDEPDYKALIITTFTATHGPYRGRRLDDFCTTYPSECQRRGDLEDFAEHAALYRKNHLALARDFPATIERLGLDDADVDRLVEVVDLLYKADVASLDGMFGEVMAQIRSHGLGNESLVAFTADHGEIHYRENAYFRWTHGYQLAPEVLNVPLLIAAPGIGLEPGAYEGVSRSIDVLPTLASLAGLTFPDGEGRGIDLTPALRGREPPPELLAFSHTALFLPNHWQRKRHFAQLAALFPEPVPELMWVAVRRGDMFFKLRRLEGASWQMVAFDLAADAGETENLYDESSADHVAMRDALRAYKQELVEAARESSSTVPPERALELLRSLGYID